MKKFSKGNIIGFYNFSKFNQSRKSRFRNLGIEFLDYFPNKAYVVAIPNSLDKSTLKNRGFEPSSKLMLR